MDEMSLPHSPLCTLITTYISHLSDTKEMEFLQNDNDFYYQRRPHSSTFSGVTTCPSICSLVGCFPWVEVGTCRLAKLSHLWVELEQGF